MVTFALVHGMWHGGWCWRKVTPLLRAAGHEVFVVTLTGLGERVHLRNPDIDLNTHIQDVINVLEYEDLNNVVLVGHSLSGIMVPAVAEIIPERLAHIVNLDGMISSDGKSVKDLLPEMWKDIQQSARASGNEWWVPAPDWTFGVTGSDLEWMRAKLTAHPLKTWLTPFSFSNPSANSIPRTFIQCTEGLSPEEITNEEKKITQMGWKYRSLPTGHNAMITAPVELAKILLALT